MRHAELKVISGKQAGSLIPLPAGKFLIGREEDCHLRPNSDTVSRHHCVFTVDDFTVRLRDLGSTNGTMVNGERIRGGVMLNPGDIVSIGKIEFEVQIRDLSLDTLSEMQVDSDTRVGAPGIVPQVPVENPPPAQTPAPVIGMDSSFQIPVSNSETMVEFPTADLPLPGQQPPTGDTQFAAPMQMPMQPALGYPQMGYPQMMPPYGYPGYPGMYPQQMGYPMPGGYPTPMPMGMPMGAPAMPPAPSEPEPEPTRPGNFPEPLAIKLPNPEETGAKPPAPKPAAPAGGDQKTAEAKAREEAPKMADDIIQQYLKRRPTPGGKK